MLQTGLGNVIPLSARLNNEVCLATRSAPFRTWQHLALQMDIRTINGSLPGGELGELLKTLNGECLAITGRRKNRTLLFGRLRHHFVTSQTTDEYVFVIGDRLRVKLTDQPVAISLMNAFASDVPLENIVLAPFENAGEAFDLGFREVAPAAPIFETHPQVVLLAQRSRLANRTLATGLMQFDGASLGRYIVLTETMLKSGAVTVEDHSDDGPIDIRLSDELIARLRFGLKNAMNLLFLR